MSAVQSHYQAQWGNATQCFRQTPVVDLRTPASTFESFSRAILTRQVQALWQTIHPRLQATMKQRFQSQGAETFFSRMSRIITNSQGRLVLGNPSAHQIGDLTCPVFRNGRKVAVAHFQMWDHQWVLVSFVDC